MAIEKALADLDALATALDRFVADEEARTRIADVRNCQYSTAARAARTRSDNLRLPTTTPDNQRMSGYRLAVS